MGEMAVAAPTRMRAAICRSSGPPEVVSVESIDVPHPDSGEVRVAVAAAAVNFPDVLLVAGRYQVAAELPFVPGSEFAGTVSAVGGGVTDLRIGDRVSGSTFVGGFGEELVVAAASLQRLPPSLDIRSAAASTVAHQTALNALRSVAELEPGEELVVLGAGGGVGLAAVELGVLLGASVTAIASTTEKLEVAAAYGATHLLDHTAGDLRAQLREVLPDGADVVIDPVGGALAEPALRALRWGGRFVTVGYASGEVPRIPLNLVLLKGISVKGFEFGNFSEHRSDDMARNRDDLLELLASGRVRPHIGATFGLDQVAEALRYVADGRAIGKVLLDVRSEA